MEGHVIAVEHLMQKFGLGVRHRFDHIEVVVGQPHEGARSPRVSNHFQFISEKEIYPKIMPK